MLDRFAVLDQLIDAGFALQRPGDGQFHRLVVGPVEIFLVEFGMTGATRVEPHRHDDAKIIDGVFRDDAFRNAVHNGISDGALHHAAEQFDVFRGCDGDLGRHHRGGACELVEVADRKETGMSGGLAHHACEGVANRAIHRADQYFRHRIGVLAFGGEDGRFAGFEDNVRHGFSEEWCVS